MAVLILGFVGVESLHGQELDRPWGPEQATGEPDTLEPGDLPTAWASRRPDDGEEWLTLRYERPVTPREVRVFQTFNPGALFRISAFDEDGREVLIWEGIDPSPKDAEMSIVTIPVSTTLRTNTIRIYLDSENVPGWNEIDAVELIGSDGSRQWASWATASSTYAAEPWTDDAPDPFSSLIGESVTVEIFEGLSIQGVLIESAGPFIRLETETGVEILAKSYVTRVAAPRQSD